MKIVEAVFEGFEAHPVVLGAGVALALGCSSGSADPAAPPDDARLRLVVVNNEDTHLSVIDHETKVVSSIELNDTPHGQIPSHRGDRLYVATEDDRQVIAVDLQRDEVLWRVSASDCVEQPICEMHQPSITADDNFVFAPSLFGGALAVVDTQTGTLESELMMTDPTLEDESKLLLGLHNTYLSGDGESVYATAIFSERIARIDIASRSIERVYEIGGQPRPAAVLRDESKMYVQLSSLVGFVEVDLRTGEETRRIELADDGERPRGWDDWTHSHGLGLNPEETEVWAANTVGGTWHVYSLPALEPIAELAVGVLPNWIAFTPDGAFAYVTNTGSNDVSVIDTASKEVVATVAVGAAPKRIHAVRVPERAGGP